ncbi:hypothetical protein C8T65DRAFT_778515 [Cerioporus squamosus]|nr:hypothetical protein C8T65DRAFT_778515 [Cerioporus squamosus]
MAGPPLRIFNLVLKPLFKVFSPDSPTPMFQSSVGATPGIVWLRSLTRGYYSRHPNGTATRAASLMLPRLSRAQEYHDEGGEYVEEIGNNYPEWKRRQEYAKLVEDGREVLEYMEDMLDRDSWSATESRDVKHASRRYRTSALRSSRKAKQERLEEGVAYVPDNSSTPAQPVGGLFNQTTLPGGTCSSSLKSYLAFASGTYTSRL